KPRAPACAGGATARVNRRVARPSGWQFVPRAPARVAQRGQLRRSRGRGRGLPQRPVGRCRVADRGSQAAAQLQDSRRQRATLDRRERTCSIGNQRERATGVEPATSSLGSWHSTTELRPRRTSCLAYVARGGNAWPIDAVPERRIRVSSVKGHARNMMTERVVTVAPDTPLVAIAATRGGERLGGLPGV